MLLDDVLSFRNVLLLVRGPDRGRCPDASGCFSCLSRKIFFIRGTVHYRFNYRQWWRFGIPEHSSARSGVLNPAITSTRFFGVLGGVSVDRHGLAPLYAIGTVMSWPE